MKFRPKTTQELDLLKQDSIILLYEYPLDYDIEVYGTYYHSPEIPDSQPTCQYASIDVEKWDAVSKIPVEFTILEELFIPDEDKDDAEPVMTRFGKVLDNALIAALVDEALKITGNEDSQTAVTRARNKWRPAGRITVYDDIAGQISLNGAKVRARRWFTTHIGYTNSAGYYSCDGRFKRDANYSIVWESNRWDIRSGWIGQAYYNGPKKSGNWDLYINSGKSLRYATIHRAAYRYYFGYIDGFARPANFRKEKICYIDDNGTGDYWANIGAGILPDIRIYGKENGAYKTTDYIFRTTTHELAHAAHCTWMSKIKYWQVSKIIYESWADFVEYSVTLLEYKSLKVPASELLKLDKNMNKQESWPLNYTEKNMAYSPLFIDLIDTYNQGVSILELPFDEVTGFTNSTLNIILLDSYGLMSLKENAKRWKPNHVTNKQIDKLFEKYETAKYK